MGGNLFAGSLSGLYTNGSLSADNLTNELIDRGLTTVNRPLKVYDATAHARRPDQEGQAVVLRVGARMGQQLRDRRLLLEQDAGHAVLHAGPDAARRPHAVVRVEGRAGDVAGGAEAQVQLLRRRSGRLHLPHGHDVPARASGWRRKRFSRFTSARPASIRPRGRRRSPAGCCSMPRGPRRSTTGPQFRSARRDEGHSRSSSSRQASATTRARRTTTRTCRTATASGSPSRTSPARTRSRSAFQDEQGILKAYRVASSSNVSYTFSNGVPVSITQYATPYELQNRFQPRHGHLRPGSVGDPQADAELRPALRLLQRVRPGAARRRDARLAARRGTLRKSTACRSGRTSIRASAPRTICSATARPR